MTDYTELVKSLRICASEPGCVGCKNHVADEHYEVFNSCTTGAEGLMKEAADAIEELQKAICPHFIRNVHDRGDDSLCTNYRCKVSALPRWR